MSNRITRRGFVGTLGLAAVARSARAAQQGVAKAASSKPAGKREAMLALRKGGPGPGYVPAAFFLHFDEASRLGPGAVKRHLEYFRFTGMDFVKVQYERTFPPLPQVKSAADWKTMPRYGLDFYKPQLEVVDALVKAAGREALVLVTLYSPFMCAGHSASRALVARRRDLAAPGGNTEIPSYVHDGLGAYRLVVFFPYLDNSRLERLTQQEIPSILAKHFANVSDVTARAGVSGVHPKLISSPVHWVDW